MECEFYNCNKSNSAGLAAVTGGGYFDSCYFHDCGGSTAGIRSTSTALLGLWVSDCIFDSLGGNGIEWINSSVNVGN